MRSSGQQGGACDAAQEVRHRHVAKRLEAYEHAALNGGEGGEKRQHATKSKLFGERGGGEHVDGDRVRRDDKP